jgi:hypothetical protein
MSDPEYDECEEMDWDEEEEYSLIQTEKEQKRWDKYSFRKETMRYLYHRDAINEELKQMKCAVSFALYTNESWQMMVNTRARKKDNGVVYGSILPKLPYSKQIHTIYTIDWNIDTGRIMGVGSILDPRNLNPSNTNGYSVNVFQPPYHFLNSYVYGGPKWVTRENMNVRFLAYVHMLEKIVHENSLIRIQKNQTKEEYIYKKRGLMRLPISYFVHFIESQKEEDMFPVGIHDLCLIILNE